MSTVRLKRLQADYDKVVSYLKRQPRLQLIQTEGTPPERYQIEYRIRSLRQKDDQLTEVSSHLVEISLPRNYPRTPPLCRMLTPVFHPNIAPHAICIGDHWSAGESLSLLVSRIGEMLAFQSYNTKSPLNGEAARWTDQNIERLPLDPINMTLDETGPALTPQTPVAPAPAPLQRPAPAAGTPTAAPASPPRTAPAPPPPAPAPAAPGAFEFNCPHCSVKLRLAARPTSKLRCPKCRLVFDPPA